MERTQHGLRRPVEEDGNEKSTYSIVGSLKLLLFMRECLCTLQKSCTYLAMHLYRGNCSGWRECFLRPGTEWNAVREKWLRLQSVFSAEVLVHDRAGEKSENVNILRMGRNSQFKLKSFKLLHEKISVFWAFRVGRFHRSCCCCCCWRPPRLTEPGLGKAAWKLPEKEDHAMLHTVICSDLIEQSVILSQL